MVVDTGSVAATPRFSCASRLIPNCADMVRRVHPSIARWPREDKLTTDGSRALTDQSDATETTFVNLSTLGHLAFCDLMVDPDTLRKRVVGI